MAVESERILWHLICSVLVCSGSQSLFLSLSLSLGRRGASGDDVLVQTLNLAASETHVLMESRDSFAPIAKVRDTLLTVRAGTLPT